MRRTIQILSVCAVIAGGMAITSSALAFKTVCASGCPFTKIQTAIEKVPSGGAITIGPGTYVENLVVNKPLTLKGEGATTIVEPSVSKPECAGGSLCGGEASNIILVEASNVTLLKLTLEGDNPSLISGVERGGKDIDARNGVITNHEVGTYNNLTVSKVIVKDVFLRGIYASSGGSFNFDHDTVENVQGNGASIGIFDFGGGGSMVSNKVSAANDAISANWSTGTVFVKNTVKGSGSGVHTDNNGGKGGTADVIKENKISACPTDGYGIFVFAPYLSPTVESNAVKGCYVGLAAFGSQVSGEGPKFVSNVVNGMGATTTDPNGTYGAYITTDLIEFGFGDVTASLAGNTLTHFGTGMLVSQEAGGQATVTASPGNLFTYDTIAGANGEPGTVVNAKENWWGCPSGPNNGGSCTNAGGTVDFTPWLTVKP
jgi:hypothetical protein